jgi:hypothetical protein
MGINQCGSHGGKQDARVAEPLLQTRRDDKDDERHVDGSRPSLHIGEI